jgi:CHAT domain-containing protein
VVLSACRTVGEGGRGSPGGLAGAFLAAGSGAVLGTLWPVEDGATARFMEAFYDRLASGESPRDALRNVQARAAEAGEPTAHWGAFVLFGTGQRPLELSHRRTAWPGWTLVALALVLAFFVYRHRRKISPG